MGLKFRNDANFKDVENSKTSKTRKHRKLRKTWNVEKLNFNPNVLLLVGEMGGGGGDEVESRDPANKGRPILKTSVRRSKRSKFNKNKNKLKQIQTR